MYRLFLPALAFLALCLAPCAAPCASRQAPGAHAPDTPLFTGRPASPPRRPAKASARGARCDMKQAVDLALKRNPTLGASEAQARGAREGKRSSLAAMGPKLGMTYSAVKAERKTDPVSTRPPELGTYSWAVEVSQPIFQGLRLLSNYQRSALQEDSDRAALKQAELALTRDVQTCFLEYLACVENSQSEREALERLREQLKITRAFHEVGLRPRLDVLQAEVDVSQAENALIQMENRRDTARARLNTLLGLAPESPRDYVGSLASPPFALNLEQCLQRAYRQRPDLYMAAKAVEIARKERMAVQSDYYPQVEAYYNVNQTGNTWDLKREGERGSRGTTWEVGARATWNVFQWGVTHFADRQAASQVNRLRYEEENLKLNVGYDIKACLLAVREAEKRIAVARTGVAQAGEAYDAALARYREQVGTNFDVLNASSNLTAAQASLTEARAAYLTALAEIYAAMGEFHPDLL